MSLPANLRIGLLSLLGVVVIGSVGFMALSDASLGDALYLTVITITTLGFGDPVVTLDGGTKAWLVVVLLSGMGAALYTVTASFEYGFEVLMGTDTRRLRRMARHIESATDHVIVCGFGRVGATAALALMRSGIDVIVIESDAKAAAEAMDAGFAVVEGDATRDEVLSAAHVDTARSVIASVASPSDNLVITLSARALRSDVAVYARAVDAETEKKLALAGANAVVTPELVGGQRIAVLATRPGLAEFIDVIARDSATEFQIRRVVVAPGSELAGTSLAEKRLRHTLGVMVIGIGSPGQPVQMNPEAHRTIAAGDVVFGIGTPDQLEALERVAATL